MPVSLLATVCLTILATLLTYTISQNASEARRKGVPLPPGPPSHPIFGHLHVVPKSNPEWSFEKWSKEYNPDVLYFNMLFQDVVVLNSTSVAMDLLDKRGLNYCDRPRFALFEMMGWKRTMAFMPWGFLFRMHRKILQSNLSKTKITQY